MRGSGCCSSFDHSLGAEGRHALAAQKRAGEAGGAAVSRAFQKVWVAKLVVQQLGAGRRRKQALRDVARAIRNIIDSGTPASGFDLTWYADLLSSQGQHKGQLKTSYARLSESELRRLAERSIDGLPTTDIPNSQNLAAELQCLSSGTEFIVRT